MALGNHFFETANLQPRPPDCPEGVVPRQAWLMLAWSSIAV